MAVIALPRRDARAIDRLILVVARADAQDALDAANDAANDGADDRTDRAGAPVAFMEAVGGAAGNALRLRGEGKATTASNALANRVGNFTEESLVR